MQTGPESGFEKERGRGEGGDGGAASVGGVQLS